MKTDPSERVYPYHEATQIGDLKYTESTGGLTKREYFAACAMQGITSNITKITGEWCGQLTPDFLATQSVKMADALITKLNEVQS